MYGDRSVNVDIRGCVLGIPPKSKQRPQLPVLGHMSPSQNLVGFFKTQKVQSWKIFFDRHRIQIVRLGNVERTI